MQEYGITGDELEGEPVVYKTERDGAGVKTTTLVSGAGDFPTTFPCEMSFGLLLGNKDRVAKAKQYKSMQGQ